MLYSVNVLEIEQLIDERGKERRKKNQTNARSQIRDICHIWI
jgi:hypothetical protein